ncbi:MAG: hypothetical protein MZV49_01465 [Rhodopseudomonas palustris]|nr:hypothetical protein [Rhodopseudomonas palustris]
MAAAAATYSSAFFIVFGILAVSVVVGIGASRGGDPRRVAQASPRS